MSKPFVLFFKSIQGFFTAIYFYFFPFVVVLLPIIEVTNIFAD